MCGERYHIIIVLATKCSPHSRGGALAHYNADMDIFGGGISTFLQSPAWEGIEKKEGRRTVRVDGTLMCAHTLPGGFHYWYCPRPTDDSFLAGAYAVAKESGAVFLKIDPLREAPHYGGVPSGSLQPGRSLVIDMTKSEEELLGAMHEKTRYNIRLAERKGVEIVRIPHPISREDRETFFTLLADTGQRNGFRIHPRAHYDALFDACGDAFSNELFIARLEGKACAAAMVNFCGTPCVATYLHGGSASHTKNAMAPHFLHWRVMQEARARGCARYDLWGIDEKKWPGLTRFKSGFGGRVIQYPASVDIVYRPFHYWAYRIARKILKK